MARYGTGFDPLTIAELQATTTIGHAFNAGADALAIAEHAAAIGLQAPGLSVAKMYRYPSTLVRM